nr:ATP-dependent Clp protease proteolytic subunit [uncultured Sellimonas sp.]
MNLLMKGSGGITQVPLESKMLQERHIFIEGEIRPEMAVRFLKQMMYLNMEGTDPVSVYINSPGGEVNSGFLMYDVIVGSRAPVRMFCTGKAYSMGAMLFACAKERYMLPNSELMLHQPLLESRVGGNVSSIRSISDSLLETKEKMNRIFSRHTGKTEKEIDEATGYDHYFTPEEAVDFHLCDQIVTFQTMMEG